MFELYSFWTWIPLFIAASVAAQGIAGVGGIDVARVAHRLRHDRGGRAGMRLGRTGRPTAAGASASSCIAMAAERQLRAARSRSRSGIACWLLAPLAWVWGFFVIADSAQFSALVTESVPPHAVGTALTVQTSLGFLLTMVSIQLIPPLVARRRMEVGFPVLAIGPAFGIAAIRRLVRASGTRSP